MPSKKSPKSKRQEDAEIDQLLVKEGAAKVMPGASLMYFFLGSIVLAAACVAAAPLLNVNVVRDVQFVAGVGLVNAMVVCKAYMDMSGRRVRSGLESGEIKAGASASAKGAYRFEKDMQSMSTLNLVYLVVFALNMVYAVAYSTDTNLEVGGGYSKYAMSTGVAAVTTYFTSKYV